jgi:hypothetical protein
VQVHRLGEVDVEAGGPRMLAVGLGPVAGDRTSRTSRASGIARSRLATS